MEQLTNKELITALETGAMPDPKERFNPAPSGRPEFGQVYIIPARVRNAIITELKSHQAARDGAKPAAKKPAPPKVKGKQPE